MTDLERALRYIINGSATLSKRPSAFPSGVGGFAVRGEGAYLITSDGRKLLDWMGSLGATPLGYSHPKILEAVTAQLRAGVIFSFPHVLEARVAEQLCAVIPCAEMIKTVKTGSEACSAAVSIARAAPGRDVILCDDIGYHGWHDAFRVLATTHPGVPDGMSAFVRPFVYGDDPAGFGWSGVAAVILEPARMRKPPDGWLARLVDEAHAHGALVIFDEMIMGGHHALAGGQEFFGVVPDIGAFGKAFGAGLPLGFVAASRDLMKHSWVVSGTFSSDALALAACEAMLAVYRDEDVIARLWRNGGALESTLRCYGDVFDVLGYAPHLSIKFKDNHRLAVSVFVQGCAKHGILFHPGVINASAAMSDTQVLETCGAVDAVLDQMKGADLAAILDGEMYQDSVRRIV